jgi:hypothetical protein
VKLDVEAVARLVRADLPRMATEGVDLIELDQTCAIAAGDHEAHRDVIEWAEGTGLLHEENARAMSKALGETWTAHNGGWARDTDLAMKLVVLNLVPDLLRRRARTFAS